MVVLLGLFAGPVFIYIGWVFFKKPQTGFQVHNWPFASPGEDGLTDAGKPAYRAKGLFIMALGLLLLGIGLLGN